MNNTEMRQWMKTHCNSWEGVPVGGILPSSPFPLLFQFHWWFPGTEPKPKPGTFLWLLPKEELAIWAKKWVVIPGDRGME